MVLVIKAVKSLGF